MLSPEPPLVHLSALFLEGLIWSHGFTYHLYTDNIQILSLLLVSFENFRLLSLFSHIYLGMKEAVQT